MKHILEMVIITCLVLSLAGCGGSLAPEVNNNDKKAVEHSQETAGNSNPDYTQGQTQEIVIDTDFIEEDSEVTARTGGIIAWDSEKMGGMPQPEDVTIFMEMDLSETLGKNFAYSYSVTGLTREFYLEYIKLAEEKFPKVIENKLSDTEGSFIASTEDFAKKIHVRYLEGNISLIQYID